MRNFDKKEFASIFSVVFFAILAIVIFWGKQGHVVIDTGRELYIPEQVMNGAVLFRDIFNIYGALAYQVNAIFYKLFGVHSNTLYIAGILTGFCIVCLIYILSRQMLSRIYSLIIALSAIVIGLCRCGVFGYAYAYSYAAIYGLFVVLIALIFLSKYLNEENKKYLYLSTFFAGMGFAFKYDYFPFLLIYPLVVFWIKKENSKTILIAVASCLSVPILSLLELFCRGLTFVDLLNTASLFKSIADVPSLEFFYKKHGVFPTTRWLLTDIYNFVIYFVVFGLFFVINKIKSWWKLLFFGLVVCACIVGSVFSQITFLPLLVFALFVLKIKDVFKNKNDLVILIALLFLSLKSFFVLNVLMYGSLALPFVLIALILILSKYYKIDNRTLLTMSILFFVIFTGKFLSMEIGVSNLLKYKLVTDRGWIAEAAKTSSSRLLVQKIISTTDKNESIVILPEGHMINFLAARRSDNFYNNLIPMYVEAFGEENIINHFESNKPDYFIISSRDTSDYGHKYFCLNYAEDLCEWIFNNYHVRYKIQGEPQYTVLRKN